LALQSGNLSIALTVGPRRAEQDQEVPLGVVRDADGTRAILLSQTPRGLARFTLGAYTLTGTFRRNAGPGLPVLSERGASGDETAVLSWRLPAA